MGSGQTLTPCAPINGGGASGRQTGPNLGRVCVAADESWSLASSLSAPAPCLPKHKPVAHISPRSPPPTDRRFGSDAGHRRRDARGGSERSRPRASPRRSESEDAAAAVVLTVATPPAVRSCAVSAGGELSCPCFQTAGGHAAGPYGSISIASACEVFVEMLELKCVPFHRSWWTATTNTTSRTSSTRRQKRSRIFHGCCAAHPRAHCLADSRAPGVLAGRAAALERERGHDQLFRDYFQPTPIFVPPLFRRRFRMSRPLFRRIMDGVKIYDDYFRAKVDALGKVGLSSYQKCTAAIRMLAYGIAGDFVDEYTRMSESTALESMYRFCRAVIGVLLDGIYPPWATLVKTIRNPASEQEARFAKEQEAARKDVERAFGILQARWAIVRHPARAWDVQTLWEVMTACVIMHNMIVEVERDDSLFDNEWDGQGELVTPQGGPASFQDILHAHHEIRDLAVHNQLQADLVEHMWQHVGSNAANNNDEGNPEA
ncbi:hypothetical protein QYE76_018325 [Lolium multiflorum]|uniref:DDE Tnp4 domain-containing protein n=1 Tax=Lolium multiflorum TaxID=4521 RepID=A0AAD8QL14_LOLMU|nr:hypothetical protein QYE76_018325 [Lolium multiflorum]